MDALTYKLNQYYKIQFQDYCLAISVIFQTDLGFAEQDQISIEQPDR